VAGPPAGECRDERRVRHCPVRGWLHVEPAAGRRHRRPGLDRLSLRRRAAGARAWRTGPPARAASLFLEERQVDPRSDPHGRGRARVLGIARVPQLRRSVERAAVLERLRARRAPLIWRLGTVTEVREETPRARTIVLDVPEWPDHLAGQHVDVRLTAEDGYQAQRSYSIASPPGDAGLALTVERIGDGEVSPYLTDELRVGDSFELRGPIGGYFTWHVRDGGPLLLTRRGSGLVP